MNKIQNTLKFTIIIPAYNSQDYIEKAINSVLNQSYKNFELIIVNDGSTDKTLDLINNFAAKDNRIRIFSKENGGYVSAIRKGIENATGDYTIFLGSDDYLDSNILNELNNAPIDNPDMFIFNTLQFNSEINKFDIYSNIDHFEYVNDDSFYENIRDIENGRGLLCNRDTSKAFKTTNLKQLFYFGKYGVDADDAFTMLFARQYHKYCFLPVTGYYNFIRKDSVSAVEKSIDVKLDIIKVWTNYFNQIRHFSKINKFEKDFLFDSLKLITGIKNKCVFFLKNGRYIRKYKKYCLPWIKRYSKVGFSVKFSLSCPFTYHIIHKIYELFKK